MILDVIVEDKKKRLKEHKARTSEEQMKELALVSERKSISFYEALAKPGLSIIGEFKKASPSMGKIEMTMEFMDRIDEYNISVDAISCLTEEDHFLGNTDYFKEIRKTAVFFFFCSQKYKREDKKWQKNIISWQRSWGWTY